MRTKFVQKPELKLQRNQSAIARIMTLHCKFHVLKTISEEYTDKSGMLWFHQKVRVNIQPDTNTQTVA